MKPTKLYVREGRRFVEAADCTGYYLNDDGSIVKQRTEESIAICVLHKVSEMVFCELNNNPPVLTWNKAKEYCSKKFFGNGRLPEIHELLTAINLFPNLFPESGFVWSNTECSYNTARTLYLDLGLVDYYTKANYYRVFAFLTVEL